jgi:hypothetical protein
LIDFVYANLVVRHDQSPQRRLITLASRGADGHETLADHVYAALQPVT